MIALLLKSWQIILGFIVGAGLCALFYSAKIKTVELEFIEKTKSIEVAAEKKCSDAQAITSEVSYAHQNKISNLQRSLADARKLYRNKCARVLYGDAASGHNGSAAGYIDAGSYDVDAESLIEFAGDAEKHRLQLIGCQDFVHRVVKK